MIIKNVELIFGRNHTASRAVIIHRNVGETSENCDNAFVYLSKFRNPFHQLTHFCLTVTKYPSHDVRILLCQSQLPSMSKQMQEKTGTKSIFVMTDPTESGHCLR